MSKRKVQFSQSSIYSFIISKNLPIVPDTRIQSVREEPVKSLATIWKTVLGSFPVESCASRALNPDNTPQKIPWIYHSRKKNTNLACTGFE